MSMIYGERVRLRAAEREDVKSFYAWVNDPDVTRYLSLYLPMCIFILLEEGMEGKKVWAF